MIDEEKEQKIHKLTRDKLDEFLESLTPEEQTLIVMIPPALFAKIWAGAISTVMELMREASKDD